jgi:hypothetical protein
MIKKIGVSRDGKYTKYRCSCGINFNMPNNNAKTTREVLRCKKCQALTDKIENGGIAKYREGRKDIQDFKDTINKYCSDVNSYEC